MAANTGKRTPAAAAEVPVDEPIVDEVPVEPAAEPEQTTDYTRRAGGYVLTDRGWVVEG